MRGFQWSNELCLGFSRRPERDSLFRFSMVKQRRVYGLGWPSNMLQDQILGLMGNIVNCIIALWGEMKSTLHETILLRNK